jgi:hypothetical protein
VTCWANAQPTPNARTPRVIHQSTRFRPRTCLLGSHQYLSSHGGVIPEKPLILGPSMRIPRLIVYGRISAQDKHITTLDSSKCASRQDTQCTTVKTEGWGNFRGQTHKSLFQRQIYSQLSKHSRRCRITF